MPTRRSLIHFAVGFTTSLSGCSINSGSGDGDTADGSTEPPTEGSGGGSTDSTEPNPSEATEGTLDVRDFGAVGNGTADDAGAIQRAIDAATVGDTVYFPEPEAHYVIAQSGEEPVICIDGETHADQLTLLGDGSDTVIKLADDPGRSYAMIEISSPEEYSLDVRDLVLDGNRRNVAEQHTPGICLDFRDNSATGSGRILVEDVEVRNANTTGIMVQYGGVECRNVTSRENGSHGFGVSTDWSGVHNPPPRFKRCLSLNNGKGSMGTGLDFSGGTGIAEDVVVRGATGNAGTKVSIGAIRFVYRRVRIVDNEGVAFQNTGNNDGATVLFDDVIGENNGGPCRLSSDATYRVSPKSSFVMTANETDTRGQIYLTDSATLTADGDVYSNRTDGSPGLHSDTKATGSYLESYYFYQTGSPVRSEKNLSIRRRERRDKVDISTVPTADEVGAWSRHQ